MPTTKTQAERNIEALNEERERVKTRIENSGPSEKSTKALEYIDREIERFKKIVSGDSILLKNQPVAKEGVLEYSDGMKAKLWEDLSKNIGRKVPILDEHPEPSNGAQGLYSGSERVYGVAEIKECPAGDRRLCADMILDDDAPVKTGYSIGYPYLEINEPGKIGNQQYDQVQSKLLIDHVALTDAPRDDEALQVAPDSKIALVAGKIVAGSDSLLSGSEIIVINRIAHDSHAFTRATDRSSWEYQKARKKLARDNPGLPDEELDRRAVLMADNMRKLGDKAMPKGKDQEEEEMSEEEKKKRAEAEKDAEIYDETGHSKFKESSGTFDSLSREQIIAELARLRAEKSASDSAKVLERKLETKLQSALDSADRYKRMYEDILTREVQIKMDSLVNDHGFDTKDFEGKHAEFINGALFAARVISKGAGGPTGGDSIEGDSGDGFLSINDFVYNHDSKKMVQKKRN